MMTLAERLKAGIDRMPGRSQAGLSRFVGVSTASVSDWFSGTTKSLKAESLRKAAVYLGCNRDWLETGLGDPGWTDEQHTSEGLEMPPVAQPMSHTLFYAGRPTTSARVPVVGTLVMSPAGTYRLEAPTDGTSIGHAEAYSSDRDAYAIRIEGDGLYPTLRHGTNLVIEPSGECVCGELVVIQLLDRSLIVAELAVVRDDSITIVPANGGKRETLQRSTVANMHAVAGTVPASKWRPT